MMLNQEQPPVHITTNPTQKKMQKLSIIHYTHEIDHFAL